MKLPQQYYWGKRDRSRARDLCVFVCERDREGGREGEREMARIRKKRFQQINKVCFRENGTLLYQYLTSAGEKFIFIWPFLHHRAPEAHPESHRELC